LADLRTGQIQGGAFQLPLNRPASVGFRNAFEKALVEGAEEVKFSQHAAERLERRHIDLSPQELGRIREGVNSLAGKGVKEGLLVLGNLRLVVGVDSRTVITAMTARDDRDVYSNIDGVAFV